MGGNWNPWGYRMGLGLLLALILMTGGLLGIWGYSAAQVNNGATLNVVDSKDALVAVDVVPTVIDWGCGAGCDGLRGHSAKCGRVTNNMSQTVDLVLSGDGCRFWLGDDSGQVQNSLIPGQSTDLYVKLQGPDEGIYAGLVMVRWTNGEAEISFEVPVEVVEPNNSDGNGSSSSGPSSFSSGDGASIPLPPAQPAGAEQDKVPPGNEGMRPDPPDDKVPDPPADSEKGPSDDSTDEAPDAGGNSE